MKYRLLATVLATLAAPALAQEPVAGFDSFTVLRLGCKEQVATLEAGLKAGHTEAYLLGATLFDVGGCLKRNPTRSAELLQAAARKGSDVAQRRLGAKFAAGEGAPQSYAMAGAWFAGRGLGNDPLTKEDYSYGYACAILQRAAQRVEIPEEAYNRYAAADLSIELGSLKPKDAKVTITSKRSLVTMTGSRIPTDYGRVYEDEFRGRINEVVAELPKPSPDYLVDVQCRFDMSFRFLYELSDAEVARRRALERP